MTRIKLINFLMDMVIKFQSILCILYDYLKDMKILALLAESERLHKRLDLLKEVEGECKKQQDNLREKIGSIEKELNTYWK